MKATKYSFGILFVLSFIVILIWFTRVSEYAAPQLPRDTLAHAEEKSGSGTGEAAAAAGSLANPKGNAIAAAMPPVRKIPLRERAEILANKALRSRSEDLEYEFILSDLKLAKALISDLSLPLDPTPFGQKRRLMTVSLLIAVLERSHSETKEQTARATSDWISNGLAGANVEQSQFARNFAAGDRIELLWALKRDAPRYFAALVHTANQNKGTQLKAQLAYVNKLDQGTGYAMLAR